MAASLRQTRVWLDGFVEVYSVFPGRRSRSLLRLIRLASRFAPTPRVALALSGFAALGFAGCAQSPQQLVASHHPKEYFPASVYGPASRRVIPDGQPIPRGGGQYLVGRPYTVAGQTYYPSERRITQVGYASWYGDAFHGRLTANGEIYDRDGLTAAHPTMPLPSYARVTNLRNNYSMIVRVNDRGPYASNRIMDVSRRVAEALEFQRGGTAKIKVEYVGRASLAGSDDAKLYATLRKNGPASPAGIENNTMFAERASPVRVASLATSEDTTGSLRPARVVEDQRPNELAAYRVRRTDRGMRGAEPPRPGLRREQMQDGGWARDSRTAIAKPPARVATRTARMDGDHLPVRASASPDGSSHSARDRHGRPVAAEARAFALREMASPPIPPHRTASAKSSSSHRSLRAGIDLAPPPRPLRFAAIAPSPTSRGTHAIRSRAE